MRLISWNVNGLRAVMKKDFAGIFEEFDADVFALQGDQLQAGQVDLDLPGYHQFWSYAERKGYSGTAVFAKSARCAFFTDWATAISIRRAASSRLSSRNSGSWTSTRPTLKTNWPASTIACSGTTRFASSAKDSRRVRSLRACRWSCRRRRMVRRVRAGRRRRRGVRMRSCRRGGAARTAAGEACAPKPVVMCGDFNVAHNEIDLKNPAPIAATRVFR